MNKRQGWKMAVTALALALAAVAQGQDGDGISGGAQDFRPGPGRPGRPNIDLEVVIDPYRVYTPDEIRAGQVWGGIYSAPVYLEDGDPRLPDARTLHEQTRFGRPRTNRLSGFAPASTNGVEYFGGK